MNKRGSFSSNFGAIAAAMGSAIGLGNIWRFPYMMGENGGALFLCFYLLIILIVGVPLVITEFSIGRMSNANMYRVFKDFSPKTKLALVGVGGLFAALLIYSFYSVVAGWTLAFLEFSFEDRFAGMDAAAVAQNLKDFTNSTYPPLGYMGLFMLINGVVLLFGVEKGIEKCNKILMPLLFAILLGLCINSLMLSSAAEGVSFMFRPDFSKLTPDMICAALGQAFFTLSLGVGTLITYGSYIRKQDNIIKTSYVVAAGDVLIALMAGLVIFPAVFTFNIEPTAGASLVFITLPNIFSQMPGGYILSILFFILLFVASLTSSISLLEVPVSVVTEEFKISRMKAISIVSAVTIVLGGLCSLSLIEGSPIMVGSRSLFDFFDFCSASVFMPFVSLIIVIFIGWFRKPDFLKEQVVGNNPRRGMAIYYSIYMFILKYIAPISIIIVFVTQIKG